jgi:hypothetical protein
VAEGRAGGVDARTDHDQLATDIPLPPEPPDDTTPPPPDDDGASTTVDAINTR